MREGRRETTVKKREKASGEGKGREGGKLDIYNTYITVRVSCILYFILKYFGRGLFV